MPVVNISNKILLSDDRPNLTPEKYSSFPSKIFFTWFDPLAWKGWKTILKVEELWDLDYENRSVLKIMYFRIFDTQLIYVLVMTTSGVLG